LYSIAAETDMIHLKIRVERKIGKYPFTTSNEMIDAFIIFFAKLFPR